MYVRFLQVPKVGMDLEQISCQLETSWQDIFDRVHSIIPFPDTSKLTTDEGNPVLIS